MGRRGLGSFLELGFRLAVLYGALGLSLEILHRNLPSEIYRTLSGVLSALPSWLVETLGLAEPLSAALLAGKVPGWVIGAAIPLIGVLAILLLSLALGLVWSFGGTLASLKNR